MGVLDTYGEDGKDITLRDDKVQESLELYTDAISDWRSIYNSAKEDLQFYGGEQWDEDTNYELQSRNRTAATINRLPQFVHQVSNQIRLNTPSIRINPVGDKADVETAEVLQGLVRHVQEVSDADVAYDTAVTNAIKCSIGFIRLDHDYSAPDTFEQDVQVKRVVNPLSVVIDPNSVEADGSDMRYAFINDQMTKKAFEDMYPDKAPVSFDAKYVDGYTGGTNEEVNVVEYFELREEDAEIGLMPDDQGGTMTVLITEDNAHYPFINRRTITKNKVWRCKMSGVDVLEEGYFPSSYIPIVPVYGEEHWIEGERKLFSLIRFAKEPQRVYNLAKSLEMELLKKAPKAQWVAAEEAVHNYQDLWKDPDKAEVLLYTSKDAQMNPVQQPIRSQPPPVPAGALQMSMGAVDDMKATMGIYDASLGQRTNETTGIAIQSRQQQGNIATAHFEDNLRRSMRHVGKIILDMIPRVYDSARVLRVIDSEDNEKMVGVNGARTEGQKVMFDLKTGKYDVSIDTGANFSTKRQETTELMTNLLQGNPQLMEVIGDLAFKYMDMAGSDQISERLKRVMNPNIVGEDEDGNELDPKAAQLQQQLQMMQEQMQQMGMALEEAQRELKNEQDANMLKAKEIQVKELEAGIKKQQMDINAFKAQADAEKDKADTLNDRARIELEALSKVMEAKRDTEEAVEAVHEAETPEAQAVKQQEAQEAYNRQMQAEALLNAMVGIQRSLEMQTAAIAAPKRVVRDESGQIIGAE